jgi:hypothetical protein
MHSRSVSTSSSSPENLGVVCRKGLEEILAAMLSTALQNGLAADLKQIESVLLLKRDMANKA